MTLPKCRWCGGAPHAGEACPLVAAIEYEMMGDVFPTWNVKRVEFHPPTPIDPTAADWKKLAEHNLNEVIRLRDIRKLCTCINAAQCTGGDDHTKCHIDWAKRIGTVAFAKSRIP